MYKTCQLIATHASQLGNAGAHGVAADMCQLILHALAEAGLAPAALRLGEASRGKKAGADENRRALCVTGIPLDAAPRDTLAKEGQASSQALLLQTVVRCVQHLAKTAERRRMEAIPVAAAMAARCLRLAGKDPSAVKYASALRSAMKQGMAWLSSRAEKDSRCRQLYVTLAGEYAETRLRLDEMGTTEALTELQGFIAMAAKPMAKEYGEAVFAACQRILARARTSASKKGTPHPPETHLATHLAVMSCCEAAYGYTRAEAALVSCLRDAGGDPCATAVCHMHLVRLALRSTEMSEHVTSKTWDEWCSAVTRDAALDWPQGKVWLLQMMGQRSNSAEAGGCELLFL